MYAPPARQVVCASRYQASANAAAGRVRHAAGMVEYLEWAEWTAQTKRYGEFFSIRLRQGHRDEERARAEAPERAGRGHQPARAGDARAGRLGLRASHGKIQAASRRR